jgi:hypothetical protein
MQGQKTFSIEEARQLLPLLRQLLNDANADLIERLEVVSAANEKYEQAEALLEKLDVAEGVEELRSARTQFQQAIEELSNAQNAYISRLNHWLDQIGSTGVILRDLRAGLLDFPAEEKGLQYLLCWRMDESDINSWHLENDGFAGRKPLAALTEYC